VKVDVLACVLPPQLGLGLSQTGGERLDRDPAGLIQSTTLGDERLVQLLDSLIVEA